MSYGVRKIPPELLVLMVLTNFIFVKTLLSISIISKEVQTSQFHLGPTPNILNKDISQTSQNSVQNIRNSTCQISQSPISRILKPNIPKPSNSNNQTPGIFSLWQSRGGAVKRRGWERGARTGQ